MKLPEWDRSKQAWDRYSAFHIGVTKSGLVQTGQWNYPPFIMFDTGEVIATQSKWDPDERGYYEPLDVSVYMTSDDNCPPLYMPDGTKVLKAWYDNGGHQYLLIDHYTGKAVSLGGLTKDNIPLRFTSEQNVSRRKPDGSFEWVSAPIPTIRAYWRGELTDPIGGPVIISQPDKQALTQEQRERKDNFVATTMAAMRLTDHPATRKKHSWQDPGPPLPVERLFAVDHWEQLTEDELRGFFFRGVARRRLELPCLLTEQP